MFTTRANIRFNYGYCNDSLCEQLFHYTTRSAEKEKIFLFIFSAKRELRRYIQSCIFVKETILSKSRGWNKPNCYTHAIVFNSNDIVNFIQSNPTDAQPLVCCVLLLTLDRQGHLDESISDMYYTLLSIRRPAAVWAYESNIARLDDVPCLFVYCFLRVAFKRIAKCHLAGISYFINNISVFISPITQRRHACIRVNEK